MSQPEFTTQSFLDWLRQQPPGREFNYWSKDGCACSSFGREVMQLQNCIATSTVMTGDGTGIIILPKEVAEAVRCQPGTIFTAAQLLDKFKP